MVPRTYPERLQEMDFPVRFSGKAIENRTRNTNTLITVLTFDKQYFRLRVIFVKSSW